MKWKSAIVTGASSGLGKFAALELGRLGYSLALVGRSSIGLTQTLKELPEDVRSRSRIVVADLSKKEEVAGLIRRCQLELKGKEVLNLLINNAGYSSTGRIEDIPTDEHERSMWVNYFSAVSLVKQVLPSMLEAGRGTIVNVTSGVALRALPFAAPYCAAKAALSSFTESLRVELATTPLRVLLFSPGPVESNFKNATVHFGPTQLESPLHPGKPASEIAKKLVQAIQSDKKRVVLGGKANLAMHLNYWSPALTDKILTKLYKVEANTIPTQKRAKSL